jgi:hypothetical protein
LGAGAVKKRLGEVMNVPQAKFPLFVHAWFRSGSTYTWGKLRNNEHLICFYEPFHEVLNETTLAEQIENHKPIEASRALRHPIQNRHYFHEYKMLLEFDGKLNFVPELSYRNYFLFPNQEDLPRLNYIQTLINHASQRALLPVFCFCRSQLRSAWIRKNFVGTHVAQIRDPLSQWESFNIVPYFRNTMIKIALDLRHNHPACFSHLPNFDRFAAALDKRQGLPSEQLYEYFLKPDDFVAIFLLIWALSAVQSISQSDLTLDVNGLSNDAAYRASVRDWFFAIGCDADFSDCSIPLSTSVDIGKADDMIVKAGRAIKQHAHSLLVCDPVKISRASKIMSDKSRKTVDLFLAA